MQLALKPITATHLDFLKVRFCELVSPTSSLKKLKTTWGKSTTHYDAK